MSIRTVATNKVPGASHSDLPGFAPRNLNHFCDLNRIRLISLSEHLGDIPVPFHHEAPLNL